MPTNFVLRLMFEWGGGCLWCDNDLALSAFGVSPIEDRLPLTSETCRHLEELSAWRDTALDWDCPPNPSPWPHGEFGRFEWAALDMLEIIRAELGSKFEVVYERL
jgi:hypothetical protein